MMALGITSGNIFKKHYIVRIFLDDNSTIPKSIDIECKNRNEQKKLFNFISNLNEESS